MLNHRNVTIVNLIINLILIWVYSGLPISLWWFVLVNLLWFVITGLGSSFIGWNYHLTSVVSNKNITENQIAITFDDGPHPEFTPKVLALLEKYNAKATFFCIGKHVEAHPEIVKKVIEAGHTLGNHTYSHSNFFGFYNTDKVTKELEKTTQIIKQFTGLQLRLYRPAFGVTNPNIRKAVNALGLTPVGWNKRSLDTTQRDAQAVLKRITTHLQKGDIILLHDTSNKTIYVLEQLLLHLQQNNMESVTVDSLCNIQAYA